MNADPAITAPASIQADPATRADTHMNRLHHRSHRGGSGVKSPQVLWLCLSPCGVRHDFTGSQQASVMPAGMAWMPLPRGGTYWAASGWAGGHMATGVPGQTVVSAMIRWAGVGLMPVWPGLRGGNWRRAAGHATVRPQMGNEHDARRHAHMRSLLDQVSARSP